MKKKRISIRTKLTMAACVIVVSVFSLCVCIFGFYSSKNKKDDAKVYLNAVVGSIRSDLLSLRADVGQIATMPYYSDVIRIINRYAISSKSFVANDDISEVSSQLLYMKSMKDIISNAYIALLNGKMFSIHYMDAINTWTEQDMPWLANCPTDGSLSMVPFHDVSFMKGEAKNAVSFVRMLKNIETMENTAFLIIDMNAEAFCYCLPKENAYGESFFIFSADGKLLYPFANQEKTVRQLGEMGNDSEMIRTDMDVPEMGLRIVGYLDARKYSNTSWNFLKTILMACLFVLGITVSLLALITRSISQPIRRLHQAMLQLTSSSFTTRIDIKTGDEIEELADGFNVMAAEIQRLLVEINESNIKERKILFTLLQGQMSPHFIYNSLETLNSMAMLSGNYQLADGIVCLSRLMRHLTDNSAQESYLQEEISFVEDYVYIQNLTSGLQVDFIQSIDLSQEYLLVPRFILQPLIENVYHHGGRKERIQLTMTSSIENDHLYLSVRNNGNSIGDERLSQIMQRINEEYGKDENRHDRHGFALRNINQRIRLLYGDEYGLVVRKTRDEEFEIVLNLPVRWEEEHEDSPC